MHNADWIAVFRQIPADLHPQLMLVLQNRQEVSIEALFRIEPTFLLVRGRMGGTTDSGMTFLGPFNELASIKLYKGLRESEVDEIFGPPKSVSQLASRSHLVAKVTPAATAPPAAPPPPAPNPTPAPAA